MENKALMEALLPNSPDEYLIMEVTLVRNVNGEVVPKLTSHKLVNSLRGMRTDATRYAAYYGGRSNSSFATYKWNPGEKRWKLLDLVLRGMDRDEFPWRKRGKKT